MTDQAEPDDIFGGIPPERVCLFPDEAVGDRRLKPAAFVVLCAVEYLERIHGAPASFDRIACFTALAPTTVKRHFATLEAIGYIAKIRGLHECLNTKR